MTTQNRINRRKFTKTAILSAAATAIMPRFVTSLSKAPSLMKRKFGKIGFEVTTMGLGGQASLQWTPEGVDPVKIILKAFDLGINYFDTSNLYGPSQANFGKAFRIKNLIPGQPGYDEKLRQSIFLTTKTHLRYAKGNGEVKGVNNWTNGEPGTHTIDDLHRSISLIFGDGKGNYPGGAYLDMVLFHNLNTREEVDAIYEGLDNPDPNAERIGALAALRDYRDDTNYAGDAPIKTYEIWRDGAKIKDIPFAPQITTDPFAYSESLKDKTAHTYIIKVVDGKGRIAESIPVTLEKTVS